MSAQKYEYRVVSKKGQEWTAKLTLERAQELVHEYNERWSASRPFRVQRRLVASWEDCDD